MAMNAGSAAFHESELIERIGKRDKSAFGEVYDRYSSLVMNIAWRILGERHEAEDTLQEVFLQVWNDAATFDPNRGGVSNWIGTITRSRAIDRLRSRKSRHYIDPALEDPLDLANDLVNPGRPEEIMESRLLVSRAIAALTEEQRVAIELAYYEGMSQSEIAETLGTPLGTIKTRIRDGLIRLKGIIAPRSGNWRV
jgi:RNA polymerase sigma-70 factor, ECF subfamily